MKKIFSTLFAACVTAASMSLAQSDLYAVIDLSEGAGATNYPVTYMDGEPVGGWVSDLSHVTNKLVLRKIETNGASYYIGVFELTQGQRSLIEGSSPAASDFPVNQVLDLGQITGAFTSLGDKTGFIVDLPTRAQWEYACRAGTTNLYHFDGGTDDPAQLGDYAWYWDNADSAVHQVGQKPSNPWGLYDLYGNVDEFCKEDIRAGGNYGSGSLECTSSSFAGSFASSEPKLGYRVCARRPILTVIGGTGGGNHLKGTTNAVAATVPANHTFIEWQVDPASATNDWGLGENFSAVSAETTVVMPFIDVTLTAVLEPILYPLTVVNGTGSGSYTNGQIVSIAANPTNTLLFEFDGWTGNTYVLADPDSANTTVTMPGSPITVTATYHDKRYALTVNDASGGGNYTNGATVTIGTSTTPPTAAHEFDHWTGDTATVADVNSAPTTFIMGAANMTLTAVFRPKFVPQNTFLTLDLTDRTVAYSDTPTPGGWTDLHKTTKMVFRKIPAGSFMMGSPTGEPGRMDNETRHPVTLTQDFYLGLFEVTQKQWEHVRGTTPSFYAGDTLPVERVSYTDIRGTDWGRGWPTNSQVDSNSFMWQLRGKNSAVGAADLPTEAQWEYACRAGSTGAYAGDLDTLTWYEANNTPAGTKVAGSKQPNAWSLYDMHGNVREICLDWYANNLGSTAQTDPKGPVGPAPQMPALRVVRGGYYDALAADVRSAWRGSIGGTNMTSGPIPSSLPMVGFRVAVPQTSISFALTVVNGSVNTGGVFAVGTEIGLSPAPADAGMKFGAWQMSPTGTVLGEDFSPVSAQTILTMPASDVTLTAIYIPESSAGLFRFLQQNPGGAVEEWQGEGSIFDITAPEAAGGYRFENWAVEPVDADLGPSFNPSNAATQVTMPAHDVALTPVFVQDIPVFPDLTPTAGVVFALDAGEGQRPAAFTASGLPTGLRIDRTTGVISGIPSKTGTFIATVTARHPDGTVVSYSLSLAVQAIDAAAQGTFTGFLFSDEGDEQQIRGLVTFKATEKGKLTAKVTLQKLSLSFSAKAWDERSEAGLYSIGMTTRNGEQMTVTVDSMNGGLSGTLSGGRLEADSFLVTGQRNAFLDRTDAAAQTVLNAFKGYYTVALPVASCEETDPLTENVQSGSGYLAVTIRDRGVVKVAGKLADGTRVSASSTLLIDGDVATIPLYVRLYSKRGVCACILRVMGGLVPAEQRLDGDPDYRMEWRYPGKSVRLPADRFVVRLGAIGAFYDTLADLHAAYAGTLFTAEPFDWMPPVVPGSSGSLMIAPEPGNPAQAKLKVAKRTGLFSGSFKVLNETTGRAVTFKYLGVLTRDGEVAFGDGAYVEKRSASGYSLKSSRRVLIGREE